MCAGQRVKLVDDLSKRSFSLFIGRPCCQYGGKSDCTRIFIFHPVQNFCAKKKGSIRRVYT